MTIQAWEVKATEDFERVLATLNKERPDGLYVAQGPLMRINIKRITGYAEKSRLPSVYNNSDAVNAGGLMFYGADISGS